MTFLEKLNKLQRKITNTDRIYVSPEFYPHLIELLSLMKPYRAVGVDKKRIGSSRDGGYVMLNDFDPVKGACSFGIGHDDSWDMEMARIGLPILQFDHTLDSSPHRHPLFHFHKIRIGKESRPSARMESIASILNSHYSSEKELILKIDIESDEWEVIADVDPEILKSFRQITIEFHNFSAVADNAWRQKARQALIHLTRYHLPVHVHGNCISPLVICRDIEIPDALELTFARQDSYQLVSTDEAFPSPYDKSNHFLLSDVKLDIFQKLDYPRQA